MENSGDFYGSTPGVGRYSQRTKREVLQSTNTSINRELAATTVAWNKVRQSNTPTKASSRS
jgi:hypothetical protein